jgi:ParB/RepB/Spo0J family partition protein
VPEAFKVLNLRTHTISIAELHPNPWNPNVMDERTFEAEKESIREYGFIDPITVRPHPSQPDIWQILDGEHRWKAAKELGFEKVLIADVGPITDVAAKKLTIIFNETRGEADIGRMGKLLAELNDELGDDDAALRAALPFTESELKHLLDIGNVDWDAWAKNNPPAPRRSRQDPTMREVVLLFNDDEHQQFEQFADMVVREVELADRSAAVLHALRQTASDL